jgi:lipopolysaccharide export LptBFGC system permease protein LptF
MSRDESDWDKKQSEKLNRDARFKDFEINDSDEEFAEEVAVPSIPGTHTESNSERSTKAAEKSRIKRIGYAALILALLSMFIWPVILGPAAIILGYMAFRGGNRGLGTWSIALGLLSFAAFFLLMRLHS